MEQAQAIALLALLCSMQVAAVVEFMAQARRAQVALVAVEQVALHLPQLMELLILAAAAVAVVIQKPLEVVEALEL